LFAGGILSAQQMNLKQYGQEQGLLNLVPQCMLQDRAGFLWVGTQAGLFRYEGSAFRAYFSESGLPADWIMGLLETSDGTLWVATQSGVARRVGDRFEPLAGLGTYDIPGRAALSGANGGTLYAATSRGLLAIHTRSGAKPTAEFEDIGVETGPVLGVYVDRRGSIWMTGRNRVFRIDRSEQASGASGRLRGNSRVTVYGPAEGLPAEPWNAIQGDRDGNLWVRSATRLLMLPERARRFVPMDQDLPPSAYNEGILNMDAQGRIVVPTDLGLARRGADRWDLLDMRRGLPINAVDCFLEDREGSIWIGLSGSGVVRWVGAGAWEAWTPAEGLSHEAIWNIRRDGTGAIWVGTDRGLNYLPRGERRWRQWNAGGLGRETIRSLAVAGDGAVWAGTARGEVVRIDPRTRACERFGTGAGLQGQKITSLEFDPEGRLWVAARNGLYRSAGPATRLRFERQQPPGGGDPEDFSKVLRSVSGAMWISGSRGLLRYDRGQWARFTMRDGLRDNHVTQFTGAPDGSIWVAYLRNIGIAHLTFAGGRPVVSHMDGKAGPRSKNIVFLGSDPYGWIWAGTDAGVDVFDGLAWHHYGRGDGLVWEDCDSDSFLADEDGSAWIGTSRGVSHFSPLKQAAPGGTPAVLVTAVTFGNRSVDPVSGQEVPFSRRSMRVHFAALTFLNESEVRFRYRLLDLNRDWIEGTERQVDYPGLGPGRYTFEVLARNAAGVWSGTPARFRFEILPPWWRTWWFDTGLLALLAVAAWQLWRWRMRRLLGAQQRLEWAVAARTSELVREKGTVDKQKREIESLLEKAQAANRAKSAFLANMSHEIRTPLNGVVGMTELVMATDLTVEQREFLHGARNSADALLAILNDILDLSKIEAGFLELNRAAFPVRQLVAGCLSVFRFEAGQKNLVLDEEVDEAVPELVVGDAARLRQILLNLAGNAVKFTAQGTVSVRVALEAGGATAPGILLHWTVADTGIGIPESQHTVIFEPFRQADNSTTRKYGGTGLGLAICSRLVEMMEGRIWVDSEPGRGSTFHFTTRLEPAGDGEPALDEVASAPPVPAVDISLPPLRKLSVLLAEDNVVNQKLSVRLLEKRGHSVTVAANGREAVALASSEAFDVVLMDVHMPEMDGFEATRRIRAHEVESRTYTPIIAVTANAMSGDREKCLKAGMDGYVNKPIDMARLIRAVEGIDSAAGIQDGSGDGI
jgi:signal transduction histidine kinase/ActR/RegA family two-component response regulator